MSFLPNGNFIHCQKGLIPVENVKIGDKVLTGEETYEKITKIKDGECDMYQVNTSDGTFYCSEMCSLPVLNNIQISWTPILQLNHGDTILTSNKVVEGEEETFVMFKDGSFHELTPTYSYLLGYTTIKLIEKTPYQDTHFNLLIKQYFNCLDYMERYKDYIESLNLTNIPEIIFCSNYHNRLMYIYGVIIGMKNVKKTDKDISFCQDFVFLRRLQMLLYSCGILSSLKENELKCDVSFFNAIQFNYRGYYNKNRPTYFENAVFLKRIIGRSIIVNHCHTYFSDGYLVHD